MTILPKGGVLINIHTSLTVRVYNIHALQTLDNRIYVHVHCMCMYSTVDHQSRALKRDMAQLLRAEHRAW